MKTLLGCLVVVILSAVPAAAEDAGVSVSAGQAVAKAWLARVDAGEYGRSWDESSGILKSAISKPDWEKAAQSARGSLGKITSRKQRSATYTRSLPGGAPDGEYVVILYDTDLEKRAAAVETVTAAREKDGSWRIAGYYIR
jgi:hypothetical protein